MAHDNLPLEDQHKRLLEKEEEIRAQRGMLRLSLDELDANNKSLVEALAKLKERNSELEQLLYQSSHGLRTPLTSIQGIIDLMEYELLSDRTEEYRQHIKRKVSNMGEILNSLTTLSRLFTNEVTKELTQVDDIVVNCISYFHELAKQKNINLHFKPDVHPQVVSTDSFLINAFLKQIVMNALVFRDSSKDGTVVISLSIIEKTLVILVQDDGDGIDAALKENIFKMFFRGSEKSAGSGLGLFIAKKAIELLNGSVTYESDYGRTVFEIRIPVAG